MIDPYFAARRWCPLSHSRCRLLLLAEATVAPGNEAEGRRSMRKSAGNGNLGVLTTENRAEMWLGMTGHWGYDEMPLELGRARTTTDVWKGGL
jgi:hypothetical protein